MLDVRPHGWFSSGFTVSRDGDDIATLRFRFVGEAGRITLHGEDLEVRRDGMVSGAWRLRRADGATLASAEKPRAWRYQVVVRAPDRPEAVHVRRRSRWRRRLDVIVADRTVGSIGQASMWGRRLVADLPADLPEPVQLLSIWMVLLLFRRDDSRAASSNTG